MSDNKRARFYPDPPGGIILPSGMIQPVPTVNTGASNGFTSLYSTNNGTNILPNVRLESLGIKANLINATGLTRNAFVATGSGILKRLWIAMDNLNSTGMFLQIYIDGELVFGNNNTTLSTDGLNANGTPLDRLFNVGYGHATVFMPEINGSTIQNTTAFGGYITYDMPFRQSLEVAFNNPTEGAGGVYWLQPFILRPMTIPRDVMALKLHCDTFTWGSCTYPNEYPMMQAQSRGNGVYLKGMKYTFTGTTGDWWEGRVRMYGGGIGFPFVTPRTGTLYTNTTDYRVSLPYTPTATVQFVATGVEDFFLSSNNWVNIGSYFEDSTQLMFRTNSPNAVGPTDTIVVARYFGTETAEKGMPSDPQQLTVTWTCGDPQVAQSGTGSLNGMIYYYA